MKMNCPKCGLAETIKYGHRRLKGGRVQRFRCNNCGSVFYEK